MKKNCLNCKYEPNWPDPIGRDYPRRIAPCLWDKPIPVMPRTMRVVCEPVSRYSDDSGVIDNCKTWEPKESNAAVTGGESEA